MIYTSKTRLVLSVVGPWGARDSHFSCFTIPSLHMPPTSAIHSLSFCLYSSLLIILPYCICQSLKVRCTLYWNRSDELISSVMLQASGDGSLYIYIYIWGRGLSSDSHLSSSLVYYCNFNDVPLNISWTLYLLVCFIIQQHFICNLSVAQVPFVP